ncbi:hypothetical protein CCP3SC5AM1_10029 [Gammaproteobacteria bacterium]
MSGAEGGEGVADRHSIGAKRLGLTGGFRGSD